MRQPYEQGASADSESFGAAAARVIQRLSTVEHQNGTIQQQTFEECMLYSIWKNIILNIVASLKGVDVEDASRPSGKQSA